MDIGGVLRDDVGGRGVDGVEFCEMWEDEGGIRVGLIVAEGRDVEGDMGIQFRGALQCRIKGRF